MAVSGKSPYEVVVHLDSDAELHHLLMSEFVRTLERSNVAPMHVLQTMVRSLGAIYREIALFHQTEQCPCGWFPETAADIGKLRMSLETGASRSEEQTRDSMPVAGQA